METWKVTASDIKSWTESNKRRSEEELLLLVRKLVMASVVPDNINMPSGDSIYTPGWDGFVQNNEKHTYVPIGLSYWEMGTNKGTGVKVKKDYEKRKNQTDLNTRSTAFYMFVTTRQWINKSTWVNQKRKEKDWMDFKAYDADDLEAWLDLCPSVHVWFANKLGKRCENVFDCEQAWVTWSTVTTPAITKDLLLHSRQNVSEKIDNALKANPQIIKIVSDSTSECFGFALAFFKSHPEFHERVLIVESQSAWNSLASIRGSLILISNIKSVPDNLNLATQNGHWVVLPQCKLEHGAERALELPRTPKEEQVPILISMGLSEHDAWDVVSETNGFLMPIRRNKRLNHGVPITPGWLNNEKLVKCALAVLLMGKWDVIYSGDQEVACTLAGLNTYATIEEDLHILSQCDDPPCRKSNGKWLAISRLDLWHLLGSRVSIALFDKYADCIKSTLGDIHGFTNKEQKIYSLLFGNREKFSDTLQKSLVELLPIISTYNNVCRNFGDYPPQSRVKVLLREIFESADTVDKWLHISSYLPLFAEASPDSFLNALEVDLDKETPFLLTLFQRENSSPFGGCYHSALLWGLEIMSWNLEYFSRVVLVLVKLSFFDPGGNYSNRPINTLNEIFCPWLPQTHASVEQRVEIISTLRKRYPDVLWNMLVSILAHKQTSHPIESPKYQNWKEGYRNETTNGEFHTYCLLSFDLLIYEFEHCFSNEKLKFVLKILSEFPEDKQDSAISILEKIIKKMASNKDVPLKEKRETALILESECNGDHYREVKKRSPEGKTLCRLRDLKTILLEGDLVGKQLYVFSADYSRNLMLSEKSYAETKRLLLEKQKQVLDTLLKDGTFEHLVDLSSNISDSRTIGFLLAEHQNSEYIEHLISFAISNEEQHSLSLLAGAVGALLARDSVVEEIFSQGLSTWSPKEFNRFLSVLPFSARTYEMIKQLPPEVESEYWTYFNPWFFNLEDADLAKLALYKLLDAGRQCTAIEQACFYFHEKKTLDSNILADILEFHAYRKTNEDYSSLSNCHILEIFKQIHANNDLSEERMLRLEIAYINFFREDDDSRHKIPPILWRKIKNDPSFLVELISYVYRADPEIESEFSELPANIISHYASKSRDILTHIGLLPFDLSSDYEASYQQALKWITAVQQGSGKINRLKTANLTLGEILSVSPTGDDGIWPHEVMRRVIEGIANDSFNRGFTTGFYNRKFRLFIQVSREIDLGDQKQADEMRENAKKLTFSFPKTSRLLNDIAASFDGRPSLSIDEFL